MKIWEYSRIWWKLTRHIEWWWTNPNTTCTRTICGAWFTTMTWRFKITSDYRRWKREDELNNIPACEFNPIADYITLMFGSNSNRRCHYRVHPLQRSSATVHVQAKAVWTIHRLNSANFGIFDPDEFNSNLNSWVKSALKIIQNDTEIAYEL